MTCEQQFGAQSSELALQPCSMLLITPRGFGFSCRRKTCAETLGFLIGSSAI